MADIFLSYAREDETRARLLAQALESAGWSVWWDRRIPHGKDFNAYIQEQLDEARCIVVLWSKASVVSQFVRDEATEGLNDGRLVPVLLEIVKPPLGFRQRQTANLSDWDPGLSHDDFERLVHSIGVTVPLSAPSAAAPEKTRLSQRVVSAPANALAPSPPANAHHRASAPPETRRGVGSSPRVIGIDLGNTNVVVAAIIDGAPMVLTNAEGSLATPAVVAFTSKGDFLVGTRAKRQAITNAENTVPSLTRFIGRRYSEIRNDARLAPYRIVAGPDDETRITIRNKSYSLPQLTALLLEQVKMGAAAALGEPVTRAVMTVPATFGDAQRRAIKEAAHLAGLDVLRTINQQTAAAIAYGLESRNHETIAVCDFGGERFDATLLEASDGLFEFKRANSDMHLGGNDLDQRIIDWIVAEFQNVEGLDLSRDRLALQRLKEAAEKAKVELSSQVLTEINLPFITADQFGPKHLAMRLTRAQFEELTDDLYRRAAQTIERTLADAGLEGDDVEDVVLVGGSMHIPRVQRTIGTLFGKAARHMELDPNHVVAIGAAMQAIELAV